MDDMSDLFLGIAMGFTAGLFLNFWGMAIYRKILVLQAKTGGVEFINGKPYRIVPESEGKGE